MPSQQIPNPQGSPPMIANPSFQEPVSHSRNLDGVRSIPEDVSKVISIDAVVASPGPETDTSCVSTGPWSTVEARAPFSIFVVVEWWVVMIPDLSNEESGGELMDEGDMGAEWSVCRPVWVRFRSSWSFPVQCHHPSVGDPQIVDTNPPVWMARMRPVVGSKTAYVRTGHS